MKIINTETKEIINITNIDFFRNLINGEKQYDKYSDVTSFLINSNLIENIKEKVDELLVNELLSSTEYSNYTKLIEYNDWTYPQCPERGFFTLENMIYLLENHKSLVDDMFADPVNLYINYSTGKLIYFWTVLSQEVKDLLLTLNIKIESKNGI